jgi:FMN phosphatase YigB (HAD superfamily)
MVNTLLLDLNAVLILGKPLSTLIEKRYNVPADTVRPFLQQAFQICCQPAAPTMYSLIEAKLNQNNIPLSQEEFYDLWFTSEQVDFEALALVNDVKGNGMMIVYISNNIRERTQYYRQHFPRLFEVADKVYFSWETGFVQPDTSVFTNIFAENNLVPEVCLYLDDNEENVRSACALGIAGEIYTGRHQLQRILMSYQQM